MATAFHLLRALFQRSAQFSHPLQVLLPQASSWPQAAPTLSTMELQELGLNNWKAKSFWEHLGHGSSSWHMELQHQGLCVLSAQVQLLGMS